MIKYEEIKEKSINELALMLMCPAEYDLNFNKKCNCTGEMNGNCFECTKKWLQSEVEE